MKNAFLVIRNANWGLMGPGSWRGTNITVYDDLSVDRVDEFNLFEDNEKKSSYNITKEEYDEIKENLELAKANDTKVEACDGESYEFTEYKDGSVVWKRDLGYIYGIVPLEKIAKIVIKDV